MSPVPILANPCPVRGPNGEECEYPPGHLDLHRFVMETRRGVRMRSTEWEIIEWNDAGQYVLTRPALGEALRRMP